MLQSVLVEGEHHANLRRLHKFEESVVGRARLAGVGTDVVVDVAGVGTDVVVDENAIHCETGAFCEWSAVDFLVFDASVQARLVTRGSAVDCR